MLFRVQEPNEITEGESVNTGEVQDWGLGSNISLEVRERGSPLPENRDLLRSPPEGSVPFTRSPEARGSPHIFLMDVTAASPVAFESHVSLWGSSCAAEGQKTLQAFHHLATHT